MGGDHVSLVQRGSQTLQHAARNTTELSSCVLRIYSAAVVFAWKLSLVKLFFLFCLALFSHLLSNAQHPGNGNMPPKPASNLGYTPPDGGWGWAVVLGSFISIGFSYAFPKSLTIYYKEIQEYFSVSYSQIAWVSSVMLASMYAGGQC